MKTKTNRLLLLLSLLAPFGAPHLASAYYDPGVQRWINRDQVGDSGTLILRRNPYAKLRQMWLGPNLFRFVKNNSCNKIDAWGLFDQDDVLRCYIKCDKFCDGPGIPNPSECLKNCYANCDIDPSKPPSPIPPPPPLPPIKPPESAWGCIKEIGKALYDLWREWKHIKEVAN